MKNIIVAYDTERAIGNKGNLLWESGEMRNDMKHFRTLTMGSAVIMGRKTLDAIGVALPGRKNVVLTKSESVDVPNVEVAHSLNDAYLITKDYADVFIIGGGEIYQQALNDVERIYATEVDAAIDNADTFFPNIDEAWRVTSVEKHLADENNKYPYKFITYERK